MSSTWELTILVNRIGPGRLVNQRVLDGVLGSEAVRDAIRGHVEGEVTNRVMPNAAHNIKLNKDT